jgi:capsule polysaccharide export protein KpsC/LpsZ
MFGRARNPSPSPNFCSKDLITDVVKAELSKSERKTVTELMKKRQQYKHTYFMQNEKEYDSKKSTTVGIFSHLLWDAALEPDDGLYSDFYVWLKDTISAGANMDEIEFVIKAHPAEEMRGSNEPIVDWLTDHYDPLPNNFSFLPPDTDVDTYQLYNQIDAGVVFSSTVGLEMAYNGIPVVVGGFPPYHGCGITITPNTKTEYKQSIHEITTLDCSDEMQKRAARFCYFLFECQHVHFPYNITEAGMSRSKKGVMIEHDKVAREDSIYQKIVRQILNGEEVLDPNCRIGYAEA